MIPMDCLPLSQISTETGSSQPALHRHKRECVLIMPCLCSMYRFVNHIRDILEVDLEYDISAGRVTPRAGDVRDVSHLNAL
jgi:hypothetical protein